MSDQNPRDDPGPGSEEITRLLTDLANDPAAPPSTVDALSVIRAARAAEAAAGGRSDEQPGPDAPREPATAAADPMTPVPGTVLTFRPRRRRTALVVLAAAAAVAGIAALVIPLTLSGGSSTTTSADSERAIAQSVDSPAAALPAGPRAAEAAPDQVAASAADGLGADAGRSAAPGAAAADSGPAAGAGDAAAGGLVPTGASCWPALTGPVVASLGAALPAGAFGAPAPLDGDCPAAPVGGASLAGATPGAVLTVRISAAEPGACVHPVAPVSEPCVPRPDGTYLVTGGPGGPTVIAYNAGTEVAIGGSADTGATPRLSADQLAAAARAVAGALG